MERLEALLSDLRFCSRRGLSQRFDSTVGAGTVLIPYGGRNQATPAQVMAALLPVEKGETSTCSVMSFGFDPYALEANPYEGARKAVVSSVAKLAAAGCDPDKAYLSFQEYSSAWGVTSAPLGQARKRPVGAFTAQMELSEAAAIEERIPCPAAFWTWTCPHPYFLCRSSMRG